MLLRQHVLEKAKTGQQKTASKPQRPRLCFSAGAGFVTLGNTLAAMLLDRSVSHTPRLCSRFQLRKPRHLRCCVNCNSLGTICADTPPNTARSTCHQPHKCHNCGAGVLGSIPSFSQSTEHLLIMEIWLRTAQFECGSEPADG